jgi:hypothetical protein
MHACVRVCYSKGLLLIAATFHVRTYIRMIFVAVVVV